MFYHSDHQDGVFYSGRIEGEVPIENPGAMEYHLEGKYRKILAAGEGGGIP